jgi:hypothetical protein
MTKDFCRFANNGGMGGEAPSLLESVQYRGQRGGDDQTQNNNRRCQRKL